MTSRANSNSDYILDIDTHLYVTVFLLWYGTYINDKCIRQQYIIVYNYPMILDNMCVLTPNTIMKNINFVTPHILYEDDINNIYSHYISNNFDVNYHMLHFSKHSNYRLNSFRYTVYCNSKDLMAIDIVLSGES